jgi:hypothetical protein
MHPDNQTNQENDQDKQQHQSTSDNNPRKDHYSYSYTYKTADPESGIPGVSSVEVNESVTEEIGPDGSKIIRRHQQEKQINKITQVVTQRVIKRQYIDPTTGQIIEYDPNNELFANLPPETVFEEHTVISDDNGGNGAPIVTTTTTSKTIPSTPTNNTKWNVQTNTNIDNLKSNLNSLTINEQDYVDNFDRYSANLNSLNQQNLTSNGNPNTNTASFRIKSHPEDNQGYPEERNMDYDPDDINCYPDDDLPYEGLIQTNNSNRTKLGHLDGIRNSGGILGRSSASGGSSSSSSSPVLFGDHSSMVIDMPLVSNAVANLLYNKKSSNNYQQFTSSSRNVQSNKINDGNYATVMLPSSNIIGAQNNIRHNNNNNNNNIIGASSSSFQNKQQQQQQQPYYSTLGNKYDNYVSRQQLIQQQQPSPAFNNSQDYG